MTGARVTSPPAGFPAEEPTPDRGGVTLWPATGTATFLPVLCAEAPGHDIKAVPIPPHRLEASPMPGP